MICSRCGTQSKEGFKFCQDCGAPLEKMAIFTVPGNNSVQKKSSFSKVVLIIAVLLMLAIGGYGAIRFFSNDSSALLPIKNAQGNWGYMNKDGKIVLSPRFAFAGRFTDGFAVVGTTGATSRIDWGLINDKGQYVINSEYRYVRPITEKLVAVAIAEEKSSVWGYMDTKGNFVIRPRFKDAYGFSDGLALVALGKDKWGFVDSKGNFVIEPNLSNRSVGVSVDGEQEPVSKFVEGLAPMANEEGLWGYVDKKGAFVIQPQYLMASAYNEGLAAVAVGKNFSTARWGYIDKKGNMVIQPQFMHAKQFSEGKALVAVSGTIASNFYDRRWGVIDKTGKFIIQGNWTFYQITHNPNSGAARQSFFANGLLSVNSQTERKRTAQGGTWGFVNANGQVVVAQKYIDVGQFQDGFASVLLEDKSIGYVDTTGKLITPLWNSLSSSAENESEKIKG